jgi:hypothetical protein
MSHASWATYGDPLRLARSALPVAQPPPPFDSHQESTCSRPPKSIRDCFVFDDDSPKVWPKV